MAVEQGGRGGDLHRRLRSRASRPEGHEPGPDGNDEPAPIHHALAPGSGGLEIAVMVASRLRPRYLTRELAAAITVLVLACGERNAAPPPSDTLPAVQPVAPESTAAADTLVGDSLMARDTLPER
jgi:hypothetical protein